MTKHPVFRALIWPVTVVLAWSLGWTWIALSHYANHLRAVAVDSPFAEPGVPLGELRWSIDYQTPLTLAVLPLAFVALCAFLALAYGAASERHADKTGRAR